MNTAFHNLLTRIVVITLLSLVSSVFAISQEIQSTPEVPEKFKLDMETASRLRPQLMPQSIVPSGRYTAARIVFEQLVEQVRGPAGVKVKGQFRIVEDGQLNAYSSPDGTMARRIPS